MNNNDDIFKSLLGHFINNFIKATDDKDKVAQFRLTLSIAGLLAFVGVEAVAILFRNNFGKKGISIIRWVLCIIAFGGMTALGFISHANKEIDRADEIGIPNSFLFTGIFYGLLTIILLLRGIKLISLSRHSQNKQVYYRGDSYLLSFLGWKPSESIKYVAEPLTVLCTGIALCFINIFCGIPLIFCAVSVWGTLAINAVFGSGTSFGSNSVQNKLAQSGYQNPQQGGGFYKIP